MIFLIDYENIHNAGLEGCQYLTAEDKVILFFSQDSNTILTRYADRLFGSGAKVEICRLVQTRKNALDFYIASKAGEYAGKEPKQQIAIISRDSGFLAVKEYWEQAAERRQSIILGEDIETCIFRAGGQDERAEEIRRVRKVQNLEELFAEYQRMIQEKVLTEKHLTEKNPAEREQSEKSEPEKFQTEKHGTENINRDAGRHKNNNRRKLQNSGENVRKENPQNGAPGQCEVNVLPEETKAVEMKPEETAGEEKKSEPVEGTVRKRTSGQRYRNGRRPAQAQRNAQEPKMTPEVKKEAVSAAETVKPEMIKQETAKLKAVKPEAAKQETVKPETVPKQPVKPTAKQESVTKAAPAANAEKTGHSPNAEHGSKTGHSIKAEHDTKAEHGSTAGHSSNAGNAQKPTVSAAKRKKKWYWYPSK